MQLAQLNKNIHYTQINNGTQERKAKDDFLSPAALTRWPSQYSATNSNTIIIIIINDNGNNTITTTTTTTTSATTTTTNDNHDDIITIT